MKEIEITAIVPVLGEKTLDECLRRLSRQTIKLKETIIIKNITPMYKAFNKGLCKVKTPFFTICDADRLYDPDSLEVMSTFMRSNVGMVSAFLEDELLGEVGGANLIRTEPAKKIKFKNSISPSTDFYNSMLKLGWKKVWAKRKNPKYKHQVHILGYHKPDYNSLYVFHKFKILGQRMLYRRQLRWLAFYISRLKESRHPMAFIALTAFCHGLCSGYEKYEKRPFRETTDYKLLKELLDKGNRAGITKEMRRYFNTEEA